MNDLYHEVPYELHTATKEDFLNLIGLLNL